MKALGKNLELLGWINSMSIDVVTNNRPRDILYENDIPYFIYKGIKFTGDMSQECAPDSYLGALGWQHRWRGTFTIVVMKQISDTKCIVGSYYG